MKTHPLRSVAWVMGGAVLLGSGMVLGFISALVRQKRGEDAAAPASPPATASPVTDQKFLSRIDDLAQAIADLQTRSEIAAPPPPQAVHDKLDAVSLRVEQLERRVEQLVNEAPATPPIDQVLAAVEQMVAAKIGGLDERLSDQVHAIDLLRNASTQTDALLQKLLHAVQVLAEQTAEKMEPGQPEPPPAAPQHDYPIA